MLDTVILHFFSMKSFYVAQIIVYIWLFVDVKSILINSCVCRNVTVHKCRVSMLEGCGFPAQSSVFLIFARVFPPWRFVHVLSSQTCWSFALYIVKNDYTSMCSWVLFSLRSWSQWCHERCWFKNQTRVQQSSFVLDTCLKFH